MRARTPRTLTTHTTPTTPTALIAPSTLTAPPILRIATTTPTTYTASSTFRGFCMCLESI